MAMIPFRWENNIYMELMEECYGTIDVNIVKYRPFDKKIKYVSVNTLEDLPSVSRISVVKIFITRVLLVLFCVFRRQKIVWTVHNLSPHSGENILLSNILKKIISMCSSKILIHSRVTMKMLKERKLITDSEKVVYCPIPSYINAYGPQEKIEAVMNQKKGPLRLLLIGGISKYKNVDVVMEAIKGFPPEDVLLKIRGGGDEKVVPKIGTTESIDYEYGYVANKDIPKLLASSDIVVTPYSMDSSLNSSADVLAFSYGKSVIGVRNGTMQDVINQQCIFPYTYESKEEHIEILRSMIGKVILLHKGDPTLLEKYGQTLKKEINGSANIFECGKCLKKIFENSSSKDNS